MTAVSSPSTETRQDDAEQIIVRIEDEDGFVTEWPWPRDRLLLANGDFVEVYEREHDRLREARS